MQREIYFDNNATTHPLPEIRDAVVQALDGRFGNPSSAHAAGDRARCLMGRARESVAALAGVDPANVLFTSGATESNNLVMQSLAKVHRASSMARVLTTAVEHSSVLKICEDLGQTGPEVLVLPVDSGGAINLAEFEQALTSHTVLAP